MQPTDLRIHYFLPHSRANGPGVRAVVWVQGCTLGCPGCFNPQTHSSKNGEWMAVEALSAKIQSLGDAIEGITVSGGEPFQQAGALLNLLQRIRAETTLSIIVFTGFTWEETLRLPQAAALLDCIDVLIAGRYNASQRLAHGLLGSINKTAYFLSPRYSMPDLQTVPEAEILITSEGELLNSGIQPVEW
jgi:anaerobic ribonucleoside-triphosphate reductase activating protein